MENEVDKVREYDPTKNYAWSPTTEFVFNGREFEILQKSLNKFISGHATDIGNIMNIVLAFNTVQAKMAENVKTGTVVEMPEQSGIPS